MKAILLLNQSAGRVRAEPQLADPAAWQPRFAAAGIEVDVWCHPAREIAAQAERAASSDADCVIAAGGDGTIRAVAEAVCATNKPLAVLPVGTLNHFARDLGMPADLDEALRVIATAVPRRIDIGTVNGRVFVNNSSIGIYSRMVLLRDAQHPRSRWGKFLAMTRAFFRVLRRFPQFTAAMRIEGETVTRTTPLILLSNNPYESGWPQLVRRHQLNGGRLGIYVVRCASRFDLLRCVFRALRQRLDRVDSIERLLAPEITIATRRKHVLVSLDGEVQRLHTPLHYRCRPGGLLVVAPPLANQPPQSSSVPLNAPPPPLAAGPL